MIPDQSQKILFRKESQLRDFLLKKVKSISGPYEFCLAKTEVPVGTRIPDIVLVCTSEKPRIDLWPYYWTYRHAAVISHLRRRYKLKIESISKRLFEEPTRLEPVMKQLTKSGAVIKTKNNCYSLSEEFSSFSADVIAVETKLKRWKEAYFQAKSYFKFANRSLVAMSPDGIPTTKESKKIFTKAGIGLVTVNGNAPKSLLTGRWQNNNNLEKEYIVGIAFGRLGHTRWSAL
jgi:hypothetical protein